MKIFWFALSLSCLLAMPIHAQTWKPYSFAQVKCSASFPAEPATAQENGVWTAQVKADNTIYQIVVYMNKPYSQANNEAVLKESMEGFINPATDHIEKQETLMVNGLPAQQIQVRSQDGTYLIFRSIVGNSKLYQVAIAGTNPAQTLTNAKRFMADFKIE